MRTAGIVGSLVLVSSAALAQPGALSVTDAPPRVGSHLVMPPGLIGENRLRMRFGASALLDPREAAGVNRAGADSSSSHRDAAQFQSAGPLAHFDVANMKILGATIGGNGVYRGAVATLNWDY